MVFSFSVARKRFHVVVEEQRERFVDAHRCEVTVSILESEPEELREKAGRSLLSRVGTMAWLSMIVIGHLLLRWNFLSFIDQPGLPLIVPRGRSG
jgi:hypothetical protein